MQQGINQHGGVAVGQHETIAIRPLGVAGVMFKIQAPKSHSHFGHAHGGTGVAGVGLLHSVHGQCADGVGHSGIGNARGCLSHDLNSLK